LYCPSSQSRCFSYFLCRVDHQAICLAPDVAIRSHAIGRRELGIEFDSPIEMAHCFAAGLVCNLVNSRHATQKQVIGIKDLGWLALRALDLGLFQPRRNRAHDARGHLILKIKDVIRRAVEAVCPEMYSARCVDELSSDAH